MASFLEDPRIYQFNPYVDTLNADALIKVEMAKQDQFNQGVEKVQGYVNSVMGLPIAKEETKQYIQSKLTQLKNNIASSTTGDFSDMRLINQIGGLTGRIANDPIVQNGVQSAVRIQEGQKRREEDRKAGKINPYNDQYFDDAVSQWMSDGRADTVFDGSYISPIDTDKIFHDELTSAHADEILQQEHLYTTDGKIDARALKEKMEQGLLPEKVTAIVKEIMRRPDVQQQLMINTYGSFRGHSDESVISQYKDYNNYKIKQLSDKINSLYSDLNTASAEDKGTISKAIAQYKDVQNDIVKNYTDAVSSGDMDGIKSELYKSTLMSDLINHYSWKTQTEKLVDNPTFKADMDIANLQLRQSEYNLSVQRETRQAAHEKFMEQIELDKAVGKTKFGDSSLNTRPQDTKEALALNRGTLLQETEEERKQMDQQFFQLINATAGRGNEPYTINPDGTTTYNTEKYGSVQAAKQAIPELYAKAKKAYFEGATGPVAEAAKNFLETANYIRVRDQKVKEIESDYQKKLTPVQNKLNSEIGSYKPVNIFLYKPTSLTGETIEDSSLYNKKLAISPGEMAKAIAGKSDVLQVDDSGPGTPKFYLKEGNKKIKVSEGDENAANYNTLFQFYQRVNNKIKSLPTMSEYKQVVTARENAYKGLQKYFDQQERVFNPAEEKDKKQLAVPYINALTNYTANGKKPEGVDNEDWISDALTKNLSTTTLGTYKDQNTGQVYLTIKGPKDPSKKQTGEKEEKIPVTEEMATRELGVNFSDEFYDKFGKWMQLSKNGNTTDVNGNGRQSSLDLPGGRIRGRYSVGVHVDKMFGNYQPVLYIYDKKTKTWYDDVKVDPSYWQDQFGRPLPSLLNGKQVMTTLQNMDEDKITNILKAENRVN